MSKPNQLNLSTYLLSSSDKELIKDTMIDMILTADNHDIKTPELVNNQIRFVASMLSAINQTEEFIL